MAAGLEAAIQRLYAATTVNQSQGAMHAARRYANVKRLSDMFALATAIHEQNKKVLPFVPNGSAGRRKSWYRGEEERHITDGYWGEGTYDSEFTTDAMVDESIGGA